MCPESGCRSCPLEVQKWIFVGFTIDGYVQVPPMEGKSRRFQSFPIEGCAVPVRALRRKNSRFWIFIQVRENRGVVASFSVASGKPLRRGFSEIANVSFLSCDGRYGSQGEREEDSVVASYGRNARESKTSQIIVRGAEGEIPTT